MCWTWSLHPLVLSYCLVLSPLPRVESTQHHPCDHLQFWQCSPSTNQILLPFLSSRAGVSIFIVICVLQSFIPGSIPFFLHQNPWLSSAFFVSLVRALIMAVYHICLPKKQLLAYFSQPDSLGSVFGLDKWDQETSEPLPSWCDCLLWIPVLISSRAF